MPPDSRHGVLFDVGYTLLDERPRLEVALRWLAGWLSRHGIPATYEGLADMYAGACRAPDSREPSLLVQVAKTAGADDELARRQRRELPWDATPLDPVAGARDALVLLANAGVELGVLANQPASAREDLRRAGFLQWIGDVWLSEEVGWAKPDPRFFQLALNGWDLPPTRIAYVGDRPDNDVAPAKALGLHTVRLRYGPHADQPARAPSESADFDAPSLLAAADHLLAWSRMTP